MTLKQAVKEYLENEPLARERKYRARAVWAILYKIHQKDTIDKESFIKVFSEIQSINRWITRHQQLERHLQGSDYNDKFMLQQKTQIGLEYESGYHQIAKKLKTI